MADPNLRVVHEVVGGRSRPRRPAPAETFAECVPSPGVIGAALAAVVLAFGGWWTRAADPRPAPAKATDPDRAVTTFEKRPFWWGSDAFRHNGWIVDSDLSADGKVLATASWDSFVVWELATGKKLLHVQESDRTLEAWAAGAAGAHLTEQSKQALGRLGR